MTQFLPPNLLALFAPRDPIPYKPPVGPQTWEKDRTKSPYIGIAQCTHLFEHPKDTPPPTRGETKAEKKKRRIREKGEKRAVQIEEEVKAWDPHSDPNANSDAFKTLFVGRINYDTSESKLRREFEVYGKIKKIHMVKNVATGRSRGYAFIEYEKERDMHAAYKSGDGKKIDDRRVLVDVERGRTVKGWRPRRLGGGLGTTRAIVEEGSEAPSMERDQSRDHREREDRPRGSERSRETRDRRDGRRTDRERGERERGDRDRERGDRERGDRGDRERGDRERGDRERGDRERGDRERGDSRRDRDRDRDRDKDREKRRRDDREKDRPRDRDRDRKRDEDGKSDKKEDRSRDKDRESRHRHRDRSREKDRDRRDRRRDRDDKDRDKSGRDRDVKQESGYESKPNVGMKMEESSGTKDGYDMKQENTEDGYYGGQYNNDGSGGKTDYENNGYYKQEEGEAQENMDYQSQGGDGFKSEQNNKYDPYQSAVPPEEY